MAYSAKPPSTISIDWIRLLWEYGISIFFCSNNEFIELTNELMRPSKRSFYEVDEKIFNLLKEHPGGLDSSELIKRLGLEKDVFEGHISGIGRKGILINKDKIIIENGKIMLI